MCTLGRWCKFILYSKFCTVDREWSQVTHVETCQSSIICTQKQISKYLILTKYQRNSKIINSWSYLTFFETLTEMAALVSIQGCSFLNFQVLFSAFLFYLPLVLEFLDLQHFCVIRLVLNKTKYILRINLHTRCLLLCIIIVYILLYIVILLYNALCYNLETEQFEYEQGVKENKGTHRDS